MAAASDQTASKPRLILFAFGDFAFNLYWQSVMLFLLFYYTEALELPVALAATTYMVASIWDGIANFAAGALVDRRKTFRSYRALLVVGSLPLGLSFALAYLPPPLPGGWAVATVFVGHLLFRTAYAAVNVPYLAMSARVSSEPDDRAFVAGVRMLFGTAAAVFVALSTVPVGGWLTGSRDAAQAYLGAAILFALIGTVILVLVGATYREASSGACRPPATIRDALMSLARNRAFVLLNLAMMAMIIAVTVLNKSVLYYFKYIVGDESAGQLALASMGVVSAAAVPAWMLLGRFLGLRTLWLVASGAATVGLCLFAALDVHRAGAMQLFLMGMQAAIVGLHFVFWALLPNTIEYGEQTTGLHVEGTVFGLAALLQRIAIGVATAILGWSYSEAGFVANVQQSSGTLAGMRATIATVPLLFLVLSCAAMLVSPLGRRPVRAQAVSSNVA
ncbi:MFS transporter [Sphingomonas arenae]|uniref:MFS transporter n=1 Tax=Sphingomonas arenae TaxID=2812555 RepID=UPI0019683F21|nr:MFS transporter [Sphingomonas arenae]